MDNKKQITSSHVSVPKNFYEMTDEEQDAFIDTILLGMSPNPAVRARANKKAQETNTD